VDWPAFLADYHRRHPAITEDLLGPMRGAGGLSPYDTPPSVVSCL